MLQVQLCKKCKGLYLLTNVYKKVKILIEPDRKGSYTTEDKENMKNLWKVGLVAAMAATTLAGCGNSGSGDSNSGETGSKDCPIRVGFVTDTGGIDDKSFNQGSWEGIQKWATENKLDPEACTGYVQSKAEADYVPNLSSLAEDDYDLVIASGYLFKDAMDEVSVKYPDTKFFVIDTVVPEKNVTSGVFAAEQSSYLVGVAAAMQAKADGGDSVGFVGGTDSELIKAFQAGYEQGVWSVDPAMKVMVDYAGAFDDPSKGQSLAEKQYGAGAKVIYHAAGGTGGGVIKTAMEKAEAGNPVWVIGVDRDQYEDGKYGDGSKSVILTSALKKVDVATYDVSTSAMNNEFKGGDTLTFNIDNDGVGVPAENPNFTDEIKTAIDKAVEEVKGGKEVSPTPALKNGDVSAKPE